MFCYYVRILISCCLNVVISGNRPRCPWIPPPSVAELAWCSQCLGCAAKSTNSVGVEKGLMRAGAGNRAGAWKGMLFGGDEESLCGV